MKLNRHEIYEFDSFRVSTSGWSLEYNGKLLHVSRMQFLLLLAFLNQPKSFLTKASLLESLWPGTHSSRTLPVYVHSLNRILSIGSHGKRLIQHVRGKGYIFVSTVKCSQESTLRQGLG
jgi:DNA-binding winged helix-turn-helix (wHTH) protein